MFRQFRYGMREGAAMAVALSLLVLSASASPAIAAVPGDRIEEGADAAAEALDPQAPPRSSFEEFAVRTLQRLNDGAARLQEKAVRAARSFEESVEDAAARLDEAWAEGTTKLKSLKGEVRRTYDVLERRTARTIERLEGWLADRQSRPTPPGSPDRSEDPGPPIAI